MSSCRATNAKGISVWEGTTKSSRSYYGEVDTWLEGKFRKPTGSEWTSIRKGECPWDGREWLKPEAHARLAVEATATEETEA